MVITLRNRWLTAKFASEDGLLAHLSARGRGPGLVRRTLLRYLDFDATRWHSNEGKADHVPIRIVSVERSGTSVASIHRSEHLEIALRFELAADRPLLAVTVSVRGLGGEARLGHFSMPGLEFTPGFTDAFEDPEDCYDDGAEFADGRERPCWRVFFRRGHRTGLLLAARAKREMARFNILAGGVDLEPHGVWNYTSVPVANRLPLIPQAGRVWEARFELGPWSAVGHRTLMREARLEKPSAVDHDPPAGRPPRNLRGHILELATLAGRSAGANFDPRRWQLVNVPWAWKGRALYASTGVRPPPLVLRPAWQGLYRVWVGIGSGAGATLRAAGDPDPRIRLRPGVCAGPRRGTFDTALFGRQQAAEVDFGVLQLDGRPLRLGRFPDLQAPCLLDYARFEPLTPAQAARWQREEKLDPVLPLSGLADTPDLAMLLDAGQPDPRAFAANIRAHARAGVRKIHWRIDGQCSDYPSRVNTMRYVSAKVHGVFVPHAKAYGRALLKTDLLRLAVDTAKKTGVSLYGWMRFNSYIGNVQSDFFRQHPEFWEESEAGTRGRQLCLVHPEVRAHKLAILREAAGYGLDGLCLGFLRQPPILQYGPALCAAYERQYGQPPPRDRKHPDTNHTRSLPVRPDPDYMRWWRFRAGYLTEFGRDLKAALREDGRGHVKVAIWVRPNHCLFDGIDLDVWLSEGLCDEVITQTYLMGEGQDPDRDWETPEWKRHVQSRVPLTRAIPMDLRVAKPLVRRILAGGYDGLCSYESNDTVLDTGFINLFRSLRRAPAAPL
jgi:hypothetical protein